MLSKILGECLWVCINAALLIGAWNHIPALANVGVVAAWVLMIVCWFTISIVAMLNGCVSRGMDEQSVKAYDSLTKIVATYRNRGKLSKTVSMVQMIISVCSIALAGWLITSVLYCVTSLAVILVFRIGVSHLDDIDEFKAKAL